MRSSHTRLLFIVLALLLAPQLAVAQAPAPQSPLVREHDIVTEGISGVVVTVITTVFRDGLVVQEAFTGQRCSHLLRAVGSRSARNQLNQALGENQAGIQPGGCRIETGAPQSTSRDSTITWFGARNRRNSFRVGDDIGTELCDEEAELIRNAIDDYAELAAVTDPDAVFVQPCQE